jgi:hypothetical protein
VASFDEVIPPGQVGFVNATLDTKKLHGSIGRGITVYTDDPVVPKLFLTVRAVVLGGVSILPYEMVTVSNRGPSNRAPKLLIRRESSETAELAIRDPEATVPWLSVAAERLEEPRPAGDGLPSGFPGDWMLFIELDETAPYGRYREQVRFKTGLGRQPDVSIPVVVDSRPPVQLSTERLVLESSEAGGVTRGTVLLTVRRGLDPKMLEVEARPETLEIELEPSGRRAYKVHVGWQGTDNPRGEITFRVGAESYSLPVFSSSDPS